MKRWMILFLLCFAFFVFTPFEVSAFSMSIKNSTNEDIVLELESSDTIEDVKEKIEDKKGILPERQKLFLEGIELEDGRTLADYNIGKESIISLVILVEKIVIDFENMSNYNMISNIEKYSLEFLINNNIVSAINEPYALLNKGKIMFYVDANNHNITLANNLIESDNVSYVLTDEDKDAFLDGKILIIPDEIELIFSTKKEVSTYKIVFDANGGKFMNGTIYTIDNWHFSLYDSLVKPTRDGYLFKGYFTERIGGIKFEMILNESGIDDDMTFYAHWEKDLSDIENQDVKNPETSDSIGNSIILGVMSLFGLVGITIYCKKNGKFEN